MKTIPIVVLALVLGLNASAQEKHTRIVSQIALAEVANNIPTTTLYTPREDGLFNISGYMVNDNPVPGSAGDWQTSLGWTDSAGTWSFNRWFVLTDTANNSTIQGLGSVLTIRARAGQPITYAVNGFAVPLGSTYSVYLTVEQVQ
ncbi:MAG: hypothetical protein H0U76_27205 [Ktedonobacteraceae bacterium]|nr:hypothetical protein [Ktedonobacteraceae bacterium]MBA3916654.1 hypothetical protein [Terriglobales bacterium]